MNPLSRDQKGTIMEDREILMPEKKAVKLGDRTYIISRLSLQQEFDITKFFIRTVISSKEKLQIIIDKTKNSESNIADFVTVADVLSIDDVCLLMGIILKETDNAFLSTNLDSAYIMQIGADVIECNKNKIESVKKNFTRIMAMLAPLFPKSEKEI